MLAQFTTVFSSKNLNIENLANKSRGDYAYTVLDLCTVVTEEFVKELEAIDGVLKVRVI